MTKNDLLAATKVVETGKTVRGVRAELGFEEVDSDLELTRMACEILMGGSCDEQVLEAS